MTWQLLDSFCFWHKMQALQCNWHQCYNAYSQTCMRFITQCASVDVQARITIDSQCIPSVTSLRSYKSFRDVSSPKRLPALTATKLLGKQPSKVPACNVGISVCEHKWDCNTIDQIVHKASCKLTKHEGCQWNIHHG